MNWVELKERFARPGANARRANLTDYEIVAVIVT
jgi:hypothetical protein